MRAERFVAWPGAHLIQDADSVQIEQFIESIFPSQGPDVVASQNVVATANGTLSSEETQKLKEREAQRKEDNFYMALAVVSVVGLMAAFMVSIYDQDDMSSTDTRKIFIAWMAGARFDLMFKDIGSVFGGSSKGHSEL